MRIAITPDGKTAYVANFSSGTVTPITTATNTAGHADHDRRARPSDIAITPDSKTAYVLNDSAGTVTPIAIATNTAEPPITTGADASTPSRSHRTARPPTSPTSVSGTVTPITTATNTAGAPITVGSYPEEIVITPDGKTAYITNDRLRYGDPDHDRHRHRRPADHSRRRPRGYRDYARHRHSSARLYQWLRCHGRLRVTVLLHGDHDGLPGTHDHRSLAGCPRACGSAITRDGTATISGTPRRAAAGVYPLTLTAKNKYGTATQAFTLTVTRAPAIKKIRAIRARVGAALRLTRPGDGIPGSGPGRVRAASQRPDLHR